MRFAAKYERGGEAVERLYQDYFLNGRDIGARGVLIQIAEDLGLNPEEFRAYLYGGGDIGENPRKRTRGRIALEFRASQPSSSMGSSRSLARRSPPS